MNVFLKTYDTLYERKIPKWDVTGATYAAILLASSAATRTDKKSCPLLDSSLAPYLVGRPASSPAFFDFLFESHNITWVQKLDLIQNLTCTYSAIGELWNTRYSSRSLLELKMKVGPDLVKETSVPHRFLKERCLALQDLTLQGFGGNGWG